MNKTYFLIILGILWVFQNEADGSAMLAQSRKGKHKVSRSSHHVIKVNSKTDSIYRSRIQSLPFEFETFYNGSVRKYIELYAIRAKRSTERTLGLGSFYFPLIDSIFHSYGVPKEMKYIAIIESSLNPAAVSRGATGMWQFTKPTGQKFGLRINNMVDERRSIIEATSAVAQYLNLLHSMYNDWRLVLAAYNCGSGRVNYAIRKIHGNKDFWKVYPHLPAITRNFVPTFMGIAYTFNFYQEYGLTPVSCGLPTTMDTVIVSRYLHLKQVATVLNIDINTLHSINTQYVKGVIPANGNRNYTLYLPANQKASFKQLQDSIFSYKVEELNRNISNTEGKASDGVGSIHKVKTGESLSVIARHYKVTVVKLKAWNKLKGTQIKPGQRLVIRNN